MVYAKSSPADLAAECDRIYPGSGSLGYLILLRGDTFTGTFTVDPATDEMTTSTAHGLVTGSRFRVSATVGLPALATGALTTTTDYYAIRISNTVLKLALSRSDANSNTAVNFVDAGTGTLTLTEQQLTETDPTAVLINKELSHPDYTRREVVDIGAAGPVGASGEKPPISFTYSAATDMTFRHILFLRGAIATIGDTTGNERKLYTLGVDTVISATPKLITIVLGCRNVI